MADTISQADLDAELVSWVVGTVTPWEEYRDDNFESEWNEYYQQWKGVFVDSGKTRSSERSKFISPALAQAIEMAVAEMEEATFGRRYWFDVEDDLEDTQKQDRVVIRDRLLEDFNLAKVPGAISEIFLNGAIYGTGIGKVVIFDKDESFTTPTGQEVDQSRPLVELEPISPKEFAIDPASRSVDEGMGCVHTPIKSKIDVQAKIDAGIYNDVPLGDFTDDEDVYAMGETRSPTAADKVEVMEYHGFVPTRFLIEIQDEIDVDLAFDDNDTDMTEAIITIANRSELLKARANPFLKRDRSFIAYQHDTVPNRFWGRGVAEKGIQSQRALNAELRARQDGLALTIHPMMGIDATRVPRGFKPQIAPGKNLMSNGDPATVFRPMHFGEMSAHTYREAGELERMMQMATGSMDSATPIGASPRNQTAAGMSMIGAGSIKRNKRTMRNVETDLLIPLINKASWRYQQFYPERYPFGDYRLFPFSTMGIIAREVEQGQLTVLNQAVQDGPVKGVVIKAFLDNMTVHNKAQIEQAIDQQFAPKPPDPMQQQIQQLQLENAVLENEKLKREIEKLQSETAENYAQAEAKLGQTAVNQFNAIAQTEDNELDRKSFGRD